MSTYLINSMRLKPPARDAKAKQRRPAKSDEGMSPEAARAACGAIASCPSPEPDQNARLVAFARRARKARQAHQARFERTLAAASGVPITQEQEARVTAALPKGLTDTEKRLVRFSHKLRGAF